MPRIIAGEFRSRRLRSPEGREVTRPMTDRVKESIFNLLRGWCEEGATVLDLFAGVGTMGLEAASRGASKVVMVEQSRKIHKILCENIEMLGCGDRVEAVMGDAFGVTSFHSAPKPTELMFVDPPYLVMEDDVKRERLLRQLEGFRPVMGERGFVVLRVPFAVAEAQVLELQGFAGPERHDYGPGMTVLLYAPA